MTTLKLSCVFRGLARVSIALRLLIIAGKSFEENENSAFRCTGRRWHVGFTCSKRVPRGLLGFHLPSDVIKKFRPSISKTPERMNSERGGSVVLGTNISPFKSLLKTNSH